MNQTAKQIKYGQIKAVNFVIDQCNQFFQINNIEMFSTHNEGKFVIAQRFIRTFKNTVYKYVLQFQKMCILIN